MILVGTSGWQYRDWRGRFYPADVPQRQWLEYFADRFATVEINNAFYRLPERETFAAWRARTPEDFRIAVKASRFLTHIKRLNSPEQPIARLLDRVDALGDRLGPVLLQLPPTLKADPDLLDAALRCFPAHVRVVVEPRHPSWWTATVRRVLEQHAAALCWADRGGRPVTPLWCTTGWGYLRLHEGHAEPRPRYGSTALRSWTRRISDAYGRRPDAYVYFNNDGLGAAVVDAAAFTQAAAHEGLPVGRQEAPGIASIVRCSAAPPARYGRR